MRSLKKMVLAGAATIMGLGILASGQAQERVNALTLIEEAPEEAWRTVSQEDLLYMDLPSGRIIIETRADFAPGHVQRIKQLTREGFYDGTIYHRVIEGFMAQGGDPTGTGTGGSDYPNLSAEFVRKLEAVSDATIIGRDRRTSDIGFIGPIPVGAQPESLRDFFTGGSLGLWGMHCKGVMSMARAGDPNSANSQFFLMFDDSRRALDQRYTVWGRVVDGFENARRINRGEPPERPTPINRMRVGSDVPAEDQVQIQVLRTDGPLFEEFLRAAGYLSENDYIDNVCGITVPVKVNGEIEL